MEEVTAAEKADKRKDKERLTFVNLPEREKGEGKLGSSKFFMEVLTTECVETPSATLKAAME